MSKILVTAFDAFGQDSSNASFELLKALPNTVKNHVILKLQVPTVRYECYNVIKKFLENEEVDYIIALGQASGSKEIRFEKVAINLDDFRIQDNQKNQPIDEFIVEKAPLAYFSKLPIKHLQKILIENQIPAIISYSAGTFVCNHLMFSLLHYYEGNSGFIHVPKIKSEDTVGIEFETLLKGMILILENIEVQEQSLKGGTLD